jgi:small subunit ribosomal protein S8
MSDPISNFLTIIRNAYRAGKESCQAPYSKMHYSIGKILEEEGYIAGLEKLDEGGRTAIKINLKYVDETPALSGVKRVSKPGRRLYFQSRDIPRTLGGLGIGILTTSRGIMKDRDARQQNVGGEMICAIW